MASQVCDKRGAIPNNVSKEWKFKGTDGQGGTKEAFSLAVALNLA